MKSFTLIIFSTLLFAACNKNLSVEEPSFDISLYGGNKVADTVVLKLSDTAKFAISGYADHILFYSGEPGHNYLHADRTSADGSPRLSFTSNAQFGLQINTLKVLAANSLAKVDSEHVVSANWTDITNRVVLSAGSGAVSSGIVNLSDIAKGPNDSLFIAFKYSGTKGTTQRTWTITNLVVNTVLSDSSAIPLLTLASDASYWTRFKVDSSLANWVTSATQLQITGGTATAPNNTAWIVSRPIYIGRINHDLPVVIKQLASAIPSYTIGGKTFTGYLYKYTQPGLYTVTIVGFNNSIEGQKDLIQQFFIRVIP